MIVTIAQDGTLDVSYAWRRRDASGTALADASGPEEDDDADEARDMATNDSSAPNVPAGATATPVTKGPHSEKLACRLNARRTAAVAAALAKQPHIALAALVHGLTVKEFAHRSDLTAIRIERHDNARDVERHAGELADDLAWKAYAIQRSAWLGVIPADSGELLAWCVEQTDERLMLILAQYVAASVDGIAPNEAPHAVNALIVALGLNLAEAWQPTRASYFDHVSKARIVDVVSAGASPAEGMRVAKLKKGDASTEAERLMQGRAWLPEHFVRAESRNGTVYRVALDEADEDEQGDVDQDAGGGATAPQADADAQDAAEAEGMPPRD